jgi:hypothetical protein
VGHPWSRGVDFGQVTCQPSRQCYEVLHRSPSSICPRFQCLRENSSLKFTPSDSAHQTCSIGTKIRESVPSNILHNLIRDQGRCAKIQAGRPSASSGASLNFALILHARLLGYIEREGDVFKSFYLIEPFALDGGPGLLSGSFAGKGYRLKSGQNL